MKTVHLFKVNVLFFSILFCRISRPKINMVKILISDWVYGSCASEDTWTDWTSRDDPGDNYDSETTFAYRQDGNEICNGDLASSIEARVIGTEADYTTTGQTVSIDPEEGFKCEDANQDGQNCENYEVRFCCP